MKSNVLSILKLLCCLYEKWTERKQSSGTSGRTGGVTHAAGSVRGSYLFGEDVLQREAQGGSQGADQSRHIKGQFGHRGQQHAADDGDERYVHL